MCVLRFQDGAFEVGSVSGFVGLKRFPKATSKWIGAWRHNYLALRIVECVDWVAFPTRFGKPQKLPVISSLGFVGRTREILRIITGASYHGWGRGIEQSYIK